MMFFQLMVKRMKCFTIFDIMNRDIQLNVTARRSLETR